MNQIFLSGRPGIGKTSVLLRALDLLKVEGYEIGGMISREFRKLGVRLGFEIIDVKTGERGLLAHVNQFVGPRVGKYRVNLNDLNNIGVRSILKAVEDADIIVVDEIGPMELFSSPFKEAVMKAIKSMKPMLGTIHYSLHDAFIEEIKAEKRVVIIEVTNENREYLHTNIIKRFIQFTKSN